MNSTEKLYLYCKSATTTNICCSRNELNLLQWYGPFTINSLKIQYVTYNKLKNFWILQKTGQIYDPEVCRCVFPASRTFLNSFYTLGKYQYISFNEYNMNMWIQFYTYQSLFCTNILANNIQSEKDKESIIFLPTHKSSSAYFHMKNIKSQSIMMELL